MVGFNYIFLLIFLIYYPMEDVDNTYYKLYVSLLNEDENEVKRIWMKNSSEKIYHKKKFVKEYCQRVKCDFMIALYAIRQTMIEKGDYAEDEMNDITNNIISLAKKRQNNPKEYIEDGLIIPCKKENINSLPYFQRLFYLPIAKVKGIENKGIKQKNYKRKEIINPQLLVENSIENPLSKKTVKMIFMGLFALDCVGIESEEDFLAFFGHYRGKKSINPKVKWRKTKSLCAYFVDSLSHNLLKKDRTQWKAFENLFDTKGLASAKNDFLKTGNPPKGHREIAALIDKSLSK